MAKRSNALSMCITASTSSGCRPARVASRCTRFKKRRRSCSFFIKRFKRADISNNQTWASYSSTKDSLLFTASRRALRNWLSAAGLTELLTEGLACWLASAGARPPSRHKNTRVRAGRTPVFSKRLTAAPFSIGPGFSGGQRCRSGQFRASRHHDGPRIPACRLPDHGQKLLRGAEYQSAPCRRISRRGWFSRSKERRVGKEG